MRVRRRRGRPPMSAPSLTEIDAAAERLAGSVADAGAGRDALWQVTGRATAGKSTCLRLAAQRLADETTLTPIVVSPPASYLDAAPAALADVAVGLSRYGLLNGELDGWLHGGEPWSRRLKTVVDAVHEHQQDVVLLLDEPRTWGANRERDDFFRFRSFQLALTLQGLPCRRIVAGDLPLPLPHQTTVALVPAETDAAWLEDPENWGVLADAAAEVAGRPNITAGLTALQVRLLVAAVALRSLGTVEPWVAEPNGLVGLVTSLIADDRRHADLWRVWLRLSLTRRTIDDQVFGAIVPAGMSRRDRDIVRSCLLYGDSELRFHEELKLRAHRWRAEHTSSDWLTRLDRATHKTLFTIHQGRFVAGAQDHRPQAIVDSIEAFHHATAHGGKELVESATPLFVEQLDALGWSLSYEHHQFGEAAKAFEHALEWDDDDDYAHHYLAYNLDRIGKRIADVEQHYRRAGDLNPEHPWWQSRLVTFLIGRGRLAEARVAWEGALAHLGLAEGDASASIYERLHCWVAGALLDAGEPRFAREVLDEVPAWAAAEIGVFRSLSQRADALLEVGEGRAVVPAWRLVPGWWLAGPDRLQYRLGDGARLVQWLAGLVESIDEKGLHVRGAVVQPGDEREPAIAWTELSFEAFDEACRDDVVAREVEPGTFLEIGLYARDQDAKGATTIVRVLPDRGWTASGLPTMDAERHLRTLT